MAGTVPRTVADVMTIPGLPRKIGNTNTEPPLETVEVFFCRWYSVYIKKTAPKTGAVLDFVFS